MHPFTAFVMRDQNRGHINHVGVDERFNPVRNWVVRMKNVEKLRASREEKILTQPIDPSDTDEHGCQETRSITSLTKHLLQIMNLLPIGDPRA